ncbi:MAG: hypothetical protein JW936_09080 [Sedimentisphaerales bacterium]|nr:hypothetical protein [Sedimentisphaerales bacterium]
MPNFFAVKEGGWPVYALIASFILLAIGGISTVYFELFYQPPIIKTLLCSECGHVMDIPQEEFQAMVDEREAALGDPCGMGMDMQTPGGMPGMPPIMMRPWGSFGWPLICPECNAESLYTAIRCPECDNVFFRGAAQDARYMDRCPECNYSQAEALQQQRREEQRN